MVEAVGRAAAGSTGEGRRQDVVALGGKDGAAAGIGRGVLGAEIGPGLEVLDGIDDAAAELAIGGAGRSEERRVGKECVSTLRSRWSPHISRTKHYTKNR